MEYDAAGSAAAGKQTAAAAREPLTRAVTAAAPLMRCPDPPAIAFRVRKQALKERFVPARLFGVELRDVPTWGRWGRCV
ncbi:hypothetical protein GCM10010300_80610 [Streptomyces olivaceoviridis]|uniref:hypothetical protein n=1 Tax=Streptomyces olivaceoviridis TaxID=1921 RepID=UPI0016784F54|nr:hypothetical protein [Streptomyces olivaceoviridis]GGZ24963.1 hypothetical protein GCM10010300_80610 [Streptomyces olivaceoviridis]